MNESRRWGDADLEKFHREFKDHIAEEDPMHRQQKELYDAVFREGDEKRGTPPGLLELTARIADELKDIRIWQDRQKTFVGGVVFTLSSVWFVLSDMGPRIIGFFKGH